MKSDTRLQVIFDTDPGIDDAMALFLLARHPAIHLRAITTVFGNASLAVTTRNAQALCGLYGLPPEQVLVAAGAAGPLQAGAEREHSTHVHGEDGLGGEAQRAIDARSALHPLDPRPAYQLICDLVNAQPGQITLIAVGPMTNLAQALRHDPGIAAKVRQVIVMGGAFGIQGRSGNVTPVAEANMINDPEAADIVFGAEWPVVIVGLDVTQAVVMDEDYLAGLQGRGGAVGDFLWHATRHYQDFYHSVDGIRGIYSHDASAIAYAVVPEAFELRAGPVRVALEGIARGQTIQKLRPPGPVADAWTGCPAQQVCIAVDSARVLALFDQVFDA
ncbi:inosine-uridine nucleoside N-ribohydrolase [Paucibacter oligotrophus]|uniref:Inosine-uridine nucleoside N-ribohydrolase n=1 Tax=Roseateles oligotrophus TaxID=1769250 RepID=A0A840L785_9BURK|nr:nucleoside hydrolase [Roseateles oligotrophus]MBB4844040.1 inosine-uridine nucleoside N-ribohydrolase [Roseateles oligotrophus]